MIIPAEDVSTEEVKSWRGLHLLHFRSSSCSQKIRILLREKDISYDSHPVNLATEAHISPWFLGINPRGVVPVLVHDGVVHVESNDILEYLDAEIPSEAPSFFPKDETERSVVRASLDLEDSLHMDLRTLTMGFIMPRRFTQKSATTLDRWEREGASDPKRALEVKWWRDFARQGVPEEQARGAYERHRAAFETLDTRLRDSEWLIGDRLSVLEVAWFITTTRLEDAGYPLAVHPRLHAWHQRLSLRPAFREETQAPFPLRAIVGPAYRGFRRFRGTTLTEVVAGGSPIRG